MAATFLRWDGTSIPRAGTQDKHPRRVSRAGSRRLRGAGVHLRPAAWPAQCCRGAATQTVRRAVASPAGW